MPKVILLSSRIVSGAFRCQEFEDNLKMNRGMKRERERAHDGFLKAPSHTFFSDFSLRSPQPGN